MKKKFISEDNLRESWKHINNLKQDKLPDGEVGQVLTTTENGVEWSNIDIPEVDLSNIEAVKLKDPVMLWGNEFDGSEDVDKDIILNNRGLIVTDTNFYISTDNRRSILGYSDGWLNIGTDVQGVTIEAPMQCIYNITAPNITEIESKLEGVTKAADDGKVVKALNNKGLDVVYPDENGNIDVIGEQGININGEVGYLYIEADIDYLATREYVDSNAIMALIIDSDNGNYENILKPINRQITIKFDNGLKVTDEEGGAPTISADTNYLATKEDLDGKANKGLAISQITTYNGGVVAQTKYPGNTSSRGSIRIGYGDIIAEPTDEENTLLLNVRKGGSIATKTYVDDKIDFLVNSEGELEDSFDTLKEVDTWIKEHESEAADIISKQNAIETWKNGLNNIKYITSVYRTTQNTDNIILYFNDKSFDGTLAGQPTLEIKPATSTAAGVMSATDKANLDSVVDKLEGVRKAADYYDTITVGLVYNSKDDAVENCSLVDNSFKIKPINGIIGRVSSVEEDEIEGAIVLYADTDYLATKEDLEANKVTPDWNATEEESGYIRNKPFGVEYKNVDLVPKFYYEFGEVSYNDGWSDQDIIPAYGNDYIQTTNIQFDYIPDVNDKIRVYIDNKQFDLVVKNVHIPNSDAAFIATDGRIPANLTDLEGCGEIILLIPGQTSDTGMILYKAEPNVNGFIELSVRITDLENKEVIKKLDPSFYNEGGFQFNNEENPGSQGVKIRNSFSNASGLYSLAEGNANDAYGNYSHAEGYQTEASGKSSHSEGENTRAKGVHSHAEGFDTESSGKGSHAEGLETVASGNYSHTSGSNTIAQNENEFACGTLNNSIQDKTIFSIGIGTPSHIEDIGPDDEEYIEGEYNFKEVPETRRNAIEVHNNGDIYIVDTSSDQMINLQEKLKGQTDVSYATKEDLESKADSSYGLQYVRAVTQDQGIFDFVNFEDCGNMLSLSGSDGIVIESDGEIFPGQIKFSVDTDVIASNERVSAIEEWKEKLKGNDTQKFFGYGMRWQTSRTESSVSFINDYINLANGIASSGRQDIGIKILEATDTQAGVMTASLYNELKAATAEIANLKAELEELKSQLANKLDSNKLWTGTQDEYDALDKDSDTYYFIKEEA